MGQQARRALLGPNAPVSPWYPLSGTRPAAEKFNEPPYLKAFACRFGCLVSQLLSPSSVTHPDLPVPAIHWRSQCRTESLRRVTVSARTGLTHKNLQNSKKERLTTSAVLFLVLFQQILYGLVQKPGFGHSCLFRKFIQLRHKLIFQRRYKPCPVYKHTFRHLISSYTPYRHYFTSYSDYIMSIFFSQVGCI